MACGTCKSKNKWSFGRQSCSVFGVSVSSMLELFILLKEKTMGTLVIKSSLYLVPRQEPYLSNTSQLRQPFAGLAAKFVFGCVANKQDWPMGSGVFSSMSKRFG